MQKFKVLRNCPQPCSISLHRWWITAPLPNIAIQLLTTDTTHKARSVATTMVVARSIVLVVVSTSK